MSSPAVISKHHWLAKIDESREQQDHLTFHFGLYLGSIVLNVLTAVKTCEYEHDILRESNG